MRQPPNPLLDKRTKQWTVQRMRTKCGTIHITGARINRGKPGMCSSKRRAYRKYAHKVTSHLEYSRPTSVGAY
jgi:hypothetical protein